MKLLALFLSVPAAVSANSPDCAALYQRHLASDMELSWREFDQTEGSGFRVLAAAGCPGEAADLIGEYLKAQEHNNHSLHWHMAQMRAEAGQNVEAVEAARRSLRASERADATFKWNDYVLAVIAFLENDRLSFERHKAVLAANDTQPGNAMNLRFLDRLDAGFGRSYAEATRGIVSRPATADK